jgi:Autotransporter beta-domain
VNKRALMLTVAALALMGTPAYAATVTGCDSTSTTDYTDITTKVTVPLCTSLANKGAPGDILIDTTGSVVVSGPTGNNALVPAITVDSSNIVSNKGTIDFEGVSSAIGVQLDSGNAAGAISGGFQNYGTIDMSGSGTSKVGILITTPTTTTSTTFTGVPLPDASDPVTTPTAIYLRSGSILEMTGDGSTGIEVSTGTSVAGDVLVDGNITISPTTANETTATVSSFGVNMLGTLNGNFTVQDSGVIDVVGPSSTGVDFTGALNGTFSNFGTIQAVGTNSPSATSTTTNATASSAVVFANNVTGGIFNAGPDVHGDTVVTATILTQGTSPALLIESSGTAPVTIGTVTNTTDVENGVDTGYSILNRGAITASSPNVNGSATGIELTGSAPADSVTLTGGIFNSGTITASGTTNESSNSVITGVMIDNNASVPNLVVSTESASGSISASASGTGPATVTAIEINTDGSLTSINNQGTISAQVATSDTTNSTLTSIAIEDFSGTLTSITNSGEIAATGTTLDDGLQVVRAADLSHSTQDITFKNTGTVVGEILFGSGADTLTVEGPSQTTPASVTGDINFGGTATAGGGGPADDSLTIGFGTVTGAIQENGGGVVDVDVMDGGTLTLTNSGVCLNLTTPNSCKQNGISAGMQAGTMTIASGGNLGISLAQPFNKEQSLTSYVGPLITTTGEATLGTAANMKISFGSFVSSTAQQPAEFVLIQSPTGMMNIMDPSNIASDITSTIPFLFTGDVCFYNNTTPTPANPADCAAANPVAPADSELDLLLAPKSAATIGLTGYAAKMFTYANAALANDPTLGAAVVEAGVGLTGSNVAKQGQVLYQQIYSGFAPDVTGAERAEAISLTDQSSGPVGARQRALRMYAGQGGEATLWGQEFTERSSVGNQVAAAGYNDSGFGFVLGMDAGDPANGRYGGAFTFFSGDTSEKAPRDTKTTSEWYMLTGYTDWRGKGFFFDSQITAGYGSIDGRRYLNIDEPGGTTFTRTANGERAAALLSGGATAGVAMTTGGTVIMPQISFDGLTLREEGYTESNDGETSSVSADGFDLHVHQDYASSLRGFAGADIRQDINLGDFFLQPEARIGYRYDFLDGAEKLRAEFVSVPNSTFTLTGPDPARGNAVLGASLATTTGAWSIGLNYDYLRGVGSPDAKDSVSQTGTLTLVGRI